MPFAPVLISCKVLSSSSYEYCKTLPPQTNMQQLLQTLTETCAPTGYEPAIQEIIRREIEPLADELRVDALGNLLARKGKKAAGGQRILLACAMNEDGLIASHLDSHGFVRFTALGTASPSLLPGVRVRFVRGARGVIGAEPSLDAEQAPAIEKRFIDVGAAALEDCPVEIGEAAAFDEPCVFQGRRVIAKALGNRAAVAVAIETLRRLERSVNEVWLAFTVRPESSMAAYALEPDIGLLLFPTSAEDAPPHSPGGLALGKGPAVVIREAFLADPRVIAWMTSAAGQAGLPIQRLASSHKGKPNAMPQARAGVPSGGLGLPCRALHSPSERMHLDDLENAVRLLTVLLSNSTPIE